MKVILAFALFIAIASAGFAPVLRFVKEKMAKVDCDTCYSDILDAASYCITYGPEDPLQCIEEYISGPCINCICEVVDEICPVLGCSWSC